MKNFIILGLIICPKLYNTKCSFSDSDNAPESCYLHMIGTKNKIIKLWRFPIVLLYMYVKVLA